MENPTYRAGQNMAPHSSDVAAPSAHPLSDEIVYLPDDMLDVKDEFFNPTKYTETFEDLIDAFLCIDEDEAMAPQLPDETVRPEDLLEVNEDFFKPSECTERVEDPDDSFLFMDEDEEMTPSPASSICGSCDDLHQLPLTGFLKCKINFKRAVKQAIHKNPKAKNPAKGVGSVATSVFKFGVFGMAKITIRKTSNSLSTKHVTAVETGRSGFEFECLESHKEGFQIVSVEDSDEDDFDYRPLDLEPEELLYYYPSDDE